MANLNWHRPPPSAGCRMTLAGRHAGSAETRLSPGRGGGPACDARSPSLACSLLSSVWPLTPVHPFHHLPPSPPPPIQSLLLFTSVSPSSSSLSVPELFLLSSVLSALLSCPSNHFLPYYYSLHTPFPPLSLCLSVYFGVPPDEGHSTRTV